MVTIYNFLLQVSHIKDGRQFPRGSLISNLLQAGKQPPCQQAVHASTNRASTTKNVCIGLLQVSCNACLIYVPSGDAGTLTTSQK